LVRRRTGIFKTSKASLYSDERGQLLVITAVAGLMLVSVAALSINAAFAYDRRNRLYAAADAAAKSGAIEVERNASISQTALEAFANQQVAAHGFTPAACGSLTGTSVCVYHPPVSGPYLGNSNFVEAVVSHRIPTFFGTVLALTQMNPGARAVAGPGPGPDCLVVLKTLPSPNDTAPWGLDIGNMRLNLPTCSITINQNLQTNSNTPTDAINATSVGIAGGCQGPACPQARQVTGVPALADPLLGDYTAPTDPGGCTAVNDPATALTPGCYSKITTGSNKTLTFSQGVYYITGPVLIGNNNVVTNTGNGVLLYFAGTAATAANCTTTSTAGCIDVANNANVTLSAQTTGPYTALLMWQNSANLMNATFNGNNPTYNLKGAMYFPRANVSFNNGLNAANDCMLFVAWTLKLDNGNGNLSNVCAGYGGSPIQTVSMAE